MRTRSSLTWLLLPTLTVVAVACAAIAWVAASGREEMAQLATAKRRVEVLIAVEVAVELEIVDLMALGALVVVPPELEHLRSEADSLSVSGVRRQIVDELLAEDARGRRLLDALRKFAPVASPVVATLNPLQRLVRERLATGDVVVPANGYVETLRWLEEQSEVAADRAEDAERQLRALVEAPPYWRTTEFVLLAMVLAGLAAAGSTVAMARVARASRRAVREARGGDRLRELAAFGRQLSSAAEPDRIGATIVDETCTLLAPEMCVLARVVDGRLVPTAARGVSGATAVALRDGAAGRAAESGTIVRAVVPHEPLLGNIAGPVSLVAAPLTMEARVAAVLLVARRGATMLDDDVESLLGLVASMSAGALAMAARVGSSLALAMDDPLTGLGNRRRLDRDLEGVDPSAPTAFLMIDVDHFKEFNDAFGHPAGDELLRLVGAAISTSLRTGDVAYRFGGEEFSVLLPGTDASTATVVAERIRAAVAAVAPPVGTRAVTVSVGVSATGTAVGLTSLVGEADRALYSAKRSGRDRTAVARPGVWTRRFVAGLVDERSARAYCSAHVGRHR